MSNNADERSLIWYSSSDPSSVQKWTGLLDTFLEGKLLLLLYHAIRVLYISN